MTSLRTNPCLVALTLTVAFATSAQTRAPELHIQLDEVVCRDVEKVSVVTNGRDHAFPAEKTSDCRWKLTEIERHNLEISYFSLRLGGIGRTPCMRAKPIEGSNDIQLKVTRRGRADALELEIAGASVDYARELPATRQGDVRCSEKGLVPGTLLGIQFDIEDLRLRLFEKKTVGCGVILDDVAALGKAKKGDLVPITVKELAPVVMRQGLKGKNCYAPTLTPPEAIEQSLSRKARFDIKVK
jgi:hypothetical protein